MRPGVVALVAVVSLAGCWGEGEPRDILDSEPRIPDDEGVATTLTFDTIILDGEREYAVSRNLIAFDTYNLQLEPMLRRRDQYVQIGVRERTMEWMAGISAVVAADDIFVASYTGVLERVDGRRAYFRDGTVLRLAPGIDAPAPGTLTEAEIDAARHEVVRMTARR